MDNLGIPPVVPPGNNTNSNNSGASGNSSLASTHLSVPSAATNANTSKGGQISKMASLKINKADQKKLLEARKKTPIEILILKIVAIITAGIAFLGFFLLVIDLDLNNKYLSVFGLAENTGQTHMTLGQENKALNETSDELDKKIKDLEDRLKNEDYFVNIKVIREIKNGQFNWVDRVNEDTGKTIIGILGSFKMMEEYFNSQDYDHPILRGNDIRVENISLDRQETKLTIVGSNLFGNVFFLNLEFVDMLNSFNFFREGSIKNFVRKRDENGDEIMTTSIKLKMQAADEKDEADEKFKEYTKWRLNKITRLLPDDNDSSTPSSSGPSARPRVAPAIVPEVKIKDNKELREERSEKNEETGTVQGVTAPEKENS